MGAGNHKMAAAMVMAADALWDASGSHNPKVAAATTNHSRSPAPVGEKQGDKRGSSALSYKSPPLPARIFSVFKTLAMACASI